MGKIKVKDGTKIYYKDWGRVNQLCFIMAGNYPLTIGTQMTFFLQKGFKVIAHNHRG